MASSAGGSGLQRAWVVCLLLLSGATAANAAGMVVQQIGDPDGRIADAVAAEAVASGVTLVPFSPRLDASRTPLVLASGKVFLARRDPTRVRGLRPAERRGIQQAYAAGQPILLLDASTHDVEALHVLLADGVAHRSDTHPTVLAYALRQENGVPRARLVTHPGVDSDPGDELDERALALRRAVGIVIAELKRPPVVIAQSDPVAGFPDWGSSPVQSTVLTSTTQGIYNTPAEVYALHSCEEKMDYYLVNTGGDWTATDAQFQSASFFARELKGDNGNLVIGWESNQSHCEGGIDVAYPGDQRICRYMNYPLSYEVDILPPPGPAVVQVNAAPAGDQGLSSSYESGFSFSISGGVDVSGSGPSGGLQAGVSWNNSLSTTVPPLAIDAGDKGGEGTFTTYKYCTVGTDPDCTSAIQMIGQEGLCRELIVGQPQNGQTPSGRLSNVAQTVYWRVDPSTYTGASFDITVSWTVQLATSTSLLWWGPFQNNPGPGEPNDGPAGYCNNFGCSCSIAATLAPTTVSHTFQVPVPTSSQCPP